MIARDTIETRNHVTDKKNIPQPDAERTIHSLETLKVYFDPVRAQIMQEVANTPRTVQQIAEALEVPFTRLYYHIKMLEKHGLIRMVDSKQMPGAIEEKYYQVAARTFFVDRKLLTFNPNNKNDGLETVLKNVFDASHKDVRHSVREGRIDMSLLPPHPKALYSRRTIIRMPEEKAAEFQRELMDIAMKYQQIETSRDDTYYAAVLALYATNIPYEDENEDLTVGETD